MNNQQAETLGHKAHTGWPTRNPVALDTWIEVFAPLDFKIAEEVLDGLIRNSKYAPPCATFLESYHRLSEAKHDNSAQKRYEYDKSAISRDEYLRRLYKRELAGDPEAREMVPIWERILRNEEASR